jgi:hypothetical protein
MQPSQSWADQAIQAVEIEHPKQAAYALRRREWTKQYVSATQLEADKSEHAA